MVIFAAILRVKKEMTREKFLGLTDAWSRKYHGVSLSSALQTFSDAEETRHWEKGCRLFLEDAPKEKITAVRLEQKGANSRQYRWEYVLDLLAYQLAVRLEADWAAGDMGWQQKLYRSTPGFLRLLINSGCLELDHGLPVSMQPIAADQENLRMLCRLLNPADAGGCALPLVYVPPAVFGGSLLPAQRLAYRLKGAAHVIVPKTGQIHKMLRKSGAISGSSLAISIVFQKAGRKERVSVHIGPGRKKKGMEAIVNHILADAGQNDIRNMDVRYTYQAVQNMALRERIEEERERLEKAAIDKVMGEADLIISSYEEDINRLKEDLYEKNLAVQGLETENERLRKNLGSGSIPLLYFGREREFYVGEIGDLVLSVLEDSLQKIPDKTRKKDVISDILAANQYQHISKSRTEQIKHMMKTYDGMNGKLRGSLEELGFMVEESKKHCKITYFGDHRYFTVLGSTPSDVRSGKNNAAMIVKMAY